jgi:hypothetical protein
VGAGAGVDLFAGSAQRGVARDVGDAGDHIEAVVEGKDQAGADGHADLLPDVEHPIMD